MLALSIIKADTGGYLGHSTVHPEMLAEAGRRTADAVSTPLPEHAPVHRPAMASAHA